MSPDQSLRLQTLLDRVNAGDAAARGELIGAAYERLRVLTRHIFRHDFAYLHERHRTESVLNDAVLRLLTGPAANARWPSALDFFRYSATIIRRTLIDLLRRHRVRGPAVQGAADESTLPEPAAPDTDPAEVAMWAEFHAQVDALPEEERAVVDLYWYHGLAQAEIARLLNLHEKAVSRRWLSARLKLADRIPGWERRDVDRG